jgi:hypothetical protein
MTHGTDSSAYCWSGVCNACSTWGWRTSHRPAWAVQADAEQVLRTMVNVATSCARCNGL